MEKKDVRVALVRVASDKDAINFGIFLNFKSMSSIGLAGSAITGRDKGRRGTMIVEKQRVQYIDSYEYQGNRRSEIIRKLNFKKEVFYIAKVTRIAKLPELSLSICFCPIFEEKPFEDEVRYELFKHIGRKPRYNGYYLRISNPTELPVSDYYISLIRWFAEGYNCGYAFKYFGDDE